MNKQMIKYFDGVQDEYSYDITVTILNDLDSMTFINEAEVYRWLDIIESKYGDDILTKDYMVIADQAFYKFDNWGG